MLLMSEGLLSLSPHNILMGSVPKGLKIRLHVILQSLAVLLITAGFIVVYLTKNHLNRDHFTTWHGLLGFIGIIGSIISCIGGAVTWYKVELRNYVPPKLAKILHYGCGICTYWCGGLSLILSVYTMWFERHTGNSYFVFGFGLILVTATVVWTSVKPVENFYKKFIKS